MSSSLPRPPKHKVAVIGGGIAGCAVARRLVELDESVDVTVLDWGRSVGGRASHRHRPEPSSSKETLTLHFDHGAQFLHVTNETFLDMVRPALEKWPKEPKRLGWLQSPTGEFTSCSDASGDDDDFGFFGACDSDLNSCRYVGVRGMNAIAKELLQGAKELAPDRLHVLEGNRVARCERTEHSSWKLYGDGLGHEQANAQAVQESKEREWGVFDELVITDHMAAAMPSWHPCHIRGLDAVVPELVSSLRGALGWNESARRFRCVRPLFTCMVALEGTSLWPLDAAAIKDNDILQWICCQESRPHESDNDTPNINLERWVLVSTPDFAQRCLGAEGMSKTSQQQQPAADKGSVQYVPQSDEYLRADPADQMLQAFLCLLERVRQKEGQIQEAPKVVLSKCQRWGAAFTSCTDKRQSFQIDKVLNEHEESYSITLCGDFVSEMTKGSTGSASNPFAIQDAALSAINAAWRISVRLKSTR